MNATFDHEVSRLSKLYPWFRAEKAHGKIIACGGIFPKEEIKACQIWQGSGGTRVLVERVGPANVYYSWESGGVKKFHDKAVFAFQCRYCLVLADAPVEVPK